MTESLMPLPGHDVKHSPQTQSKLGMDAFLSRHRGFVGKIKTRAGDFRVAEIDLSGRVVHLDGGTETGTPSSSDGFTTLRLSSDREIETEPTQDPREGTSGLTCGNSVDISTSTVSVLGEQLTFDDLTDLATLAPILRGIIGAQLVDALRTFAESELALNTPDGQRNCSPSPTPVRSVSGDGSERQGCFSLGEINDKKDRALVHKAVQCLYPHLKTSTAKLNGNHSVLVSGSSTYWDFRRALAAPQTERIVRFASSPFSTRTVSLVPEGEDSKEKRTAIHRLVSRHFGRFLETKTCSVVGTSRQEVVVRFRERYAGRRGRGVKRTADGMIDGKLTGPVYTGFTLKKENREMLDTLQQLARALRIQTSDFSYAGVKDKKAVTLQSVAVKGIGQNRFQKMIKGVNLPGVAVGNVHPRTTAIRVGDLTGNLFDILIRDVHLHGDADLPQKDAAEGALLWRELDSSFQATKEQGFVNYFGEQRFGVSDNGESQSAAIGKSILAGKYEEAVQQILGPDGEKDDPVNVAKRHFQQTQNAGEALARMPRYKSRECLVLKALRRHGLDREGCTRALLAIPHAMRQFYVHAFCSLVWNAMASRRLQLYGYQVVAGDLVLSGDEVMVTRDKVQAVTAADVQAKTFSIRDVVLPLLGNNIQYPGNSVGGAYAKYLEEAGLGSCAYRPTELQMNVPGNYRRLIQWPRDLQWGLEHSIDDEVSIDTEGTEGKHRHPKRQVPQWGCNSIRLTDENRSGDCEVAHDETDAQKQNCSGPSQRAGNFPESRTRTETSSQGPDGGPADGKSTAEETNVRVQFILPSSTYATVFLREVMKT